MNQDEAVFSTLRQWLPQQPVVLASVLRTRGATPRQAGSKMLIGAAQEAFSVGGGEAEARVVARARALLADGGQQDQIPIALTGKLGAAGVCGGHMQVALRRWDPSTDQDRAQAIAAQLQAGRQVVLHASDLGAPGATETAHPNARLLIVGAGHCGLALHGFATRLDFDVWVFDSRPACFASGAYLGATCLSGAHGQLLQAFDTERAVYAVLLNRDFHQDTQTLQVLAQQPLRFLGMMGSRKRIRQVRASLPQVPAGLWERMHAPVGLALGAQTPHEIAVSILAQLIRHRSRGDVP